MRVYSAGFAGTFLLSALVAACSVGNPSAPCNDNGQCLPGYICIDERCIEAPVSSTPPAQVPTVPAIRPQDPTFTTPSTPPLVASRDGGVVPIQPDAATPPAPADAGQEQPPSQPPLPPPLPPPPGTPALGRSCEIDPALCDSAEPVCFGGSCTGTCQFNSDCPVGWCCSDVQGDGAPTSQLCVSDSECGAINTGIPRNRRCSVNTDCPRNGACVSGECFPTGGAGLSAPGESCGTPSDCDLARSDHCVLRMSDGALITGESAAHPLAVDAVCAPACDSAGECPSGSCCRLARMTEGMPGKFCFAETGGACAAVSDRYTSCDWVNPTTCDPTQSENCLFFEMQGASGEYCTSTCNSNVDCGGSGACCPVDGSGVSYCIQGLTTCP